MSNRWALAIGGAKGIALPRSIFNPACWITGVAITKSERGGTALAQVRMSEKCSC